MEKKNLKENSPFNIKLEIQTVSKYNLYLWPLSIQNLYTNETIQL